MIEGVVGLIGQGKTMYMVRRLLRAKRQGKHCLANFHCRFRGDWEYATWAKMMDSYNAFIAIDEAHNWFKSRKWTETEQEELAYFQQSRKEGVDILWSCQDERRLDVAIREVTAFIYKCRRIGPVVLVAKCTPEEMKKPLSRSAFLITDRLKASYSTAERIGGKRSRGAGLGRSAALADASDRLLKDELIRVERYGCVTYLRKGDPRSFGLLNRSDAASLSDLAEASLMGGRAAYADAAKLVRSLNECQRPLIDRYLRFGGRLLPLAEHEDLSQADLGELDTRDTRGA